MKDTDYYSATKMLFSYRRENKDIFAISGLQGEM